MKTSPLQAPNKTWNAAGAENMFEEEPQVEGARGVRTVRRRRLKPQVEDEGGGARGVRRRQNVTPPEVDPRWRMKGGGVRRRQNGTPTEAGTPGGGGRAAGTPGRGATRGAPGITVGAIRGVGVFKGPTAAVCMLVLR